MSLINIIKEFTKKILKRKIVDITNNKSNKKCKINDINTQLESIICLLLPFFDLGDINEYIRISKTWNKLLSDVNNWKFVYNYTIMSNTTLKYIQINKRLTSVKLIIDQNIIYTKSDKLSQLLNATPYLHIYIYQYLHQHEDNKMVISLNNIKDIINIKNKIDKVKLSNIFNKYTPNTNSAINSLCKQFNNTLEIDQYSIFDDNRNAIEMDGLNIKKLIYHDCDSIYMRNLPKLEIIQYYRHHGDMHFYNTPNVIDFRGDEERSLTCTDAIESENIYSITTTLNECMHRNDGELFDQAFEFKNLLSLKKLEVNIDESILDIKQYCKGFNHLLSKLSKLKLIIITCALKKDILMRILYQLIPINQLSNITIKNKYALTNDDYKFIDELKQVGTNIDI